MVQNISIPWGAWYESEEEKTLEFPDAWDVQVFPMRDAEDITSPEAIETALANPIGTPPLETLAAGKSNAVIVVEDISRPTKCAPICEALLAQLNAAGIPDSHITVIAAVGSHRPMDRRDYLKKIGEEVLDRVNVENHHPYENLVQCGESKLGTPIHVNKTYYEAEVKIAVSTVVPHPLAGFGGGAKIILPGISGIETLAANHQAGVRGIGVGLGFITELRKDIEDVCSRVGLDFSVNIVATSRRGIAGIHAGHYIEAHRKAVEQALQVYHTDIPIVKGEDRFDIGFFNAFPEDTEFSQVVYKGLNALAGSKHIFKRKFAAAIMSAASEGRGYHSLQWETGARLYEDSKSNLLYQTLVGKQPFGVFSPNITRTDMLHFLPESAMFHRNFGDLICSLEERIGTILKAAIFPLSIQLF
ncbi:MAG TPA: lactate racemase domain-containing protein [Candidatus Lokiarchaeia archaeon]|nr:lactate racemase domain-containing protein [Candidatus Lokiarchaeia archaeon]